MDLTRSAAKRLEHRRDYSGVTAHEGQSGSFFKFQVTRIEKDGERNHEFHKTFTCDQLDAVTPLRQVGSCRCDFIEQPCFGRSTRDLYGCDRVAGRDSSAHGEDRKSVV